MSDVRRVELYAGERCFEIHAEDPSGATIDHTIPFSYGLTARDVFGMLEFQSRIECEVIR